MTENKPRAKKKCAKGSAPRRVRKEYPSPQNELEKTYRRLGVTAEQVAAVPQIRPRLRQAGLTTGRVVEILSGDHSPEAQSFVAFYAKLSHNDRRRASIEALTLAAGLSTRRLWEVLSGAAMEQGRDTVRLMLSAAQPEIVARTIKGAKLPLGHIDREHIYRAVGFFPISKGSQVFISVGKPVEEKSEEIGEEEDGTGSLPRMDDYLMDIQRAISPATKSLPVPASKQTVEAEFVDLPPGELS